MYGRAAGTGSSNFKARVNGRELDDLWVMDLARESAHGLAWERVRTGSPAPPGALQRCHSAVLVGGRKLVFFGGGVPGGVTNGPRACSAAARVSPPSSGQPQLICRRVAAS